MTLLDAFDAPPCEWTLLDTAARALAAACAVARLLAYVYQLQREDAEVTLPDDLPVPEDYLDPRTARRARR